MKTLDTQANNLSFGRVNMKPCSFVVPRQTYFFKNFREFAKNDGVFSQCKDVLEKCSQDVELLRKLSSINVKLEGACTKGKPIAAFDLILW